jgi:hypothetical protein
VRRAIRPVRCRQLSARCRFACDFCGCALDGIAPHTSRRSGCSRDAVDARTRSERRCRCSGTRWIRARAKYRRGRGSPAGHLRTHRAASVRGYDACECLTPGQPCCPGAEPTWLTTGLIPVSPRHVCRDGSFLAADRSISTA